MSGLFHAGMAGMMRNRSQTFRVQGAKAVIRAVSRMRLRRRRFGSGRELAQGLYRSAAARSMTPAASASLLNTRVGSRIRSSRTLPRSSSTLSAPRRERRGTARRAMARHLVQDA